MKQSTYRDLGRRTALENSTKVERRNRNIGGIKQGHTIALVTAINDTTPPTVTVGGREMRYPSDYGPEIGDEVVYLGGRDPVVLMKLKSSEPAWTPTLEASVTNPNLGTSPEQWSDFRIDNGLVTAFFHLKFGTSSSAGSGTYRVPLPAKYPIGLPYDTGYGVGRCHRPASTLKSVICYIDPGAHYVYFRATEVSHQLITNTVPFTWTDGDQIDATITYPTDFGF